MKKMLMIGLLILAVAGIALAQTGMKKKRPLPYDYGRIVLNNFSEKASLSPVVFDHWLHRAKFTCRLCHVDLAFAMKEGATGIKASDNMSGYYCGACHAEKAIAGTRVFGSCSNKKMSPDEARSCERCHSYGKAVHHEYDFSRFTAAFPRERLGNGVNWEKTEADGLIQPIDFLEGISMKRQSLTAQKDFALSAKMENMPDIMFSHKKHTVWSGCELCHPEIFLGVKKGATKYSMLEIFEGRYCGVCHGTVAFPLLDCQRCHTRPVQS